MFSGVAIKREAAYPSRFQGESGPKANQELTAKTQLNLGTVRRENERCERGFGGGCAKVRTPIMLIAVVMFIVSSLAL